MWQKMRTSAPRRSEGAARCCDSWRPRGRLLHLSETYTSRMGRAQQWIFGRVAAGSDMPWGLVERALRFPIRLIGLAPYLEILAAQRAA